MRHGLRQLTSHEIRVFCFFSQKRSPVLSRQRIEFFCEHSGQTFKDSWAPFRRGNCRDCRAASLLALRAQFILYSAATLSCTILRRVLSEKPARLSPRIRANRAISSRDADNPIPT